MGIIAPCWSESGLISEHLGAIQVPKTSNLRQHLPGPNGLGRQNPPTRLPNSCSAPPNEGSKDLT